jgi:hypothetical protein
MIPTEYGLSEYDCKPSVMRMTGPTIGCWPWKKICYDGCLDIYISEHGRYLHITATSENVTRVSFSFVKNRSYI